MQALRFEKDKKLELVRDAPRPISGEGEVLVQVRLAGICQTDLEIVKGYMGFSGILGHEFVGQVEDQSSAPPDLWGKRVVGAINCGCGRCRFCVKDMSRHCPSRTVLGIWGRDGCFAEYLTLPAQNLRVVPEGVSDEAAVFCEPLAAALEIFEQVPIETDSRVLILGDGKLGMLTALAFRQGGLRITLSGKHAANLSLAADLGVPTAAPDDLIPADFDVVVEATGSAEGRAAAASLVRPRGILVVKSTLAQAESWDWTPIVVNEITVVGSRCGRMEPALDALAEGLSVEALINGSFRLDQALQAFALAEKPGVLKVLLDMRPTPSG